MEVSPEDREPPLRKEVVALWQLVFATFLFGVSFVVQKRAMYGSTIGPFTYNACRYIVSTVLLVLGKPLFKTMMRVEIDDDNRIHNFSGARILVETMKWGTICGFSSFIGSNLQQLGLVTISAGKAAFLTGMYVIFVPIAEWILPGFGNTLSWSVWLAAGLSLFGAFLLSGCSDPSVGCLSFAGQSHGGELIVFISMFCWVVSIIAADVGAKRGVDGVNFTILEFSICTVFSIALALYLEPSQWRYPFTGMADNWSYIVTVGITEGTSFLLSTLGQMYVDPTKSAIIFSLESVVGAAGGYVFLGEILKPIELLGCVIILASGFYCSYEISKEEKDALASTVGGEATSSHVTVPVPPLPYASLDVVEVNRYRNADQRHTNATPLLSASMLPFSYSAVRPTEDHR